jgi:hypothetical protein
MGWLPVAGFAKVRMLVLIGCETDQQMCIQLDVMVLNKKFLFFRTLTNYKSFHGSCDCHSHALPNPLFKLSLIEAGIIYYYDVLFDSNCVFVLYFHRCISLYKTKK